MCSNASVTEILGINDNILVILGEKKKGWLYNQPKNNTLNIYLHNLSID